MENLFFYLFSLLTIVFAVSVISVRNPVHSVLFLMLVFCNVTVLLILLQSEFLALIFLMVYVGAIAVLFLFVVMMLNIRMIEWSQYLYKFLPIGSFIGFVLLIQMLAVLKSDFSSKPSLELPEYVSWISLFNNKSNIQLIGELLYTYHSISVIISSLVLLVAMIGAIVLTMYKRLNLKRQSIIFQTRRNALDCLKYYS